MFGKKSIHREEGAEDKATQEGQVSVFIPSPSAVAWHNYLCLHSHLVFSTRYTHYIQYVHKYKRAYK